jgi:murein DD-endopeptidase MepM/ murein hydrolase activator NlpD
MALTLMAPANAPAQDVASATTCTCSALSDADDKPMPVPPPLRTALVNGTRISSGFGMRMHPIFRYIAMHWGIDIAAPCGSPIYTTADGVVEVAGLMGDYGNYLRIRHGSAYATAYAHASRFATGIYLGAHVTRGQIIGYSGSSGLSTGPHLHYEMYLNGNRIRPPCDCAPQLPHQRRPKRRRM